MRGPETIVPTEQRYDTTIHQHEAFIDDYITDCQERSATHDILDFDTEVRFLDERWSEFFFSLMMILDDSDKESGEVFAALQRGFVFGFQLADLTSDGPLSMAPRRIASINDSNIKDAITSDVQEYLSNNQFVDAIIGKYMPELDPSGQNAALVETAAGLAFLLSEDAHGEQIFRNEIEELEREL